MSEYDAFEAWHSDLMEGSGPHICPHEAWELKAWQAACAWQRGKDAGICYALAASAETDNGNACADAIRGQK